MGYVGLREALKPGEVPEKKTMSYDRRPALVVDDDPEARKVLKDFLRLRGLAVLEARNGLEALLSVKQHRPGVVVLDLNMPRLGGLETLKRIRPFDPTITVAIVTEDPDAAIHQQARALGATVVLTKPVDLTQLETALGLGPTHPQPIAPVPRSTAPLPEAPPRPPAVKLEYSTDRGSAYPNAIVASTPNTNADFKIRGAFALTAPNGGEKWAVGSSRAITWTKTGSIANVKLEYSKDSFATASVIAAATPNTGS